MQNKNTPLRMSKNWKYLDCNFHLFRTRCIFLLFHLDVVSVVSQDFSSLWNFFVSCRWIQPLQMTSI